MSKAIELDMTESERAEFEAIMAELDAWEARQQQHNLTYSKLQAEIDQIRTETRAMIDRTWRNLCGDR